LLGGSSSGAEADGGSHGWDDRINEVAIYDAIIISFSQVLELLDYCRFGKPFTIPNLVVALAVEGCFVEVCSAESLLYYLA